MAKLMGRRSHDHITLYKSVITDWSERDCPAGLGEANFHNVTA